MIKRFFKCFKVFLSLFMILLWTVCAMVGTTDTEDPTIFIFIIMCLPFLGLVLVIESVKRLYNE